MGGQAQLQIGNKPSYEVGNGRTEFIPTAGLTRIMLSQGSPERSCEVTMRAFDAPRLERLAWEGPLTVAKPATIYWSVVNAVNVRVQIKQRNRQIFELILANFFTGESSRWDARQAHRTIRIC